MRIRSRRIRRWTRRLVKWGLVTFVLLTIANWTIAYLISIQNHRRIDQLHAALGARSLEELAGLRRIAGAAAYEGVPGVLKFEQVPVRENGWYLMLGACACIGEASFDALGDEENHERGQGQGAPMNDAQKTAMEQELDNAHRLLELARKAPRILAHPPYWGPREGWFTREYASHSFTELALRSARYRLESGDTAKAVKRWSDALMIPRQLLRQPSLIHYLMAVTRLRAILEQLGPQVPSLSEESLASLEHDLGEVGLKDRLMKAIGGDVLYTLSLWQHGMTRDLQEWTGYPPFVRWIYFRSLSELDKSVYLDRMLPQVLEPESLKTASATAKSVPFYALVTARLGKNLGPSLARTQAECERKLAIAREAIRLALAHRREGGWPAPRTTIDGVAIRVTETGESITLAEPPRDGHPPYRIVLRK